METELVLLGTKGGPAVRQGGAMPTSSLLKMGGQTLVVDCGIGVTRSLVEAGVPLTELDAIFITHLHSDHLLELGPLIYTAWTGGLNRPLTIFGPKGTAGYWENFIQSMSFDHTIRVEDEGRPSLVDLIHVEEYGEGQVTMLGPVQVSALQVDHPPVTECYSLSFESAKQKIVFSADTCYFPPLAEFAKRADILVHEAMLEAGIASILKRTPAASRLEAHLRASHTFVSDVGKIASKAGVGKLVLHHLIPADDPDITDEDWQKAIAPYWSGELVIGKDGMRIPL